MEDVSASAHVALALDRHSPFNVGLHVHGTPLDPAMMG